MKDTETLGFLLGMTVTATTYTLWYAGLFVYTRRKTKKLLDDAQFEYDFGRYGEAYQQAHQVANGNSLGGLSLFIPKKSKQKATALVSRIEDELNPSIEEEVRRAVRLPQEQVEIDIHLQTGTCYIEDPNNPSNPKPPFNDSLKLKEISPTYRRYFETAG